MRLIDADALVEKFDYEGWIESAIAVEGEPTIDAVPVVRCRECIHSDDGWLCDSPFHGGRTFPGDYCSNGQRREDGLYQSLKRGLEEAIAYERGEVECQTDRRERTVMCNGAIR